MSVPTKRTTCSIITVSYTHLFLRAYFYWLTLRAFGPVPIIPDEGIDYTQEYDELAYPRNSYDECVEYITGELTKAASVLPLQRGVQEITRPTRGAALALRAKVLLYLSLIHI